MSFDFSLQAPRQINDMAPHYEPNAEEPIDRPAFRIEDSRTRICRAEPRIDREKNQYTRSSNFEYEWRGEWLTVSGLAEKSGVRRSSFSYYFMKGHKLAGFRITNRRDLDREGVRG